MYGHRWFDFFFSSVDVHGLLTKFHLEDPDEPAFR